MTSADGPARGTAGAGSPWFARIAADLLDAGNMKEALRVCVEGTRTFPRYTTGRLMLGKCYEALGSHVEAMLEYARVLEVFPDNGLVRELLRRAGQREQQGFEAFAGEWQARWQGRKDRLTFEDYVGPAAAAGDSAVGEIIAGPEETPRIEPPVEAPRETATDVAPDAPKAPLASEAPLASQAPPAAPAQGRFVTATLAEIYASQGEFSEAIEAYRTLAAQRPGSAQRYQKRLEELEELKRKTEQGTSPGVT
ncbi:MAG TPA: tetratricopeptide repeat protein [Bacteroidota bacterium]|nr:tetratricopeptide repeat protein [Bacteroidota bacterium]